MNKTEADYAAVLELRRHAGEVDWWKFEGIKLRLADNTFYTCDFAVMLKGGIMQMHEVKGYMTDDAAAKIKIAAELYPFEFFVCRKKSKFFWDIRPVGNNRVPEIISTEPSQCQKQG